MAYEYIAQTYGLIFRPGQKVSFTEYSPPRSAVVCREDKGNAHYVRIRFDGRRDTSLAHPRSLEPIT